MEKKILFLSSKDVQEILGIGRNKALALMSHEGFPSIKIGRTYRVREDDLNEWIEQHKGKSVEL